MGLSNEPLDPLSLQASGQEQVLPNGFIITTRDKFIIFQIT